MSFKVSFTPEGLFLVLFLTVLTTVILYRGLQYFLAQEVPRPSTEAKEKTRETGGTSSEPHKEQLGTPGLEVQHPKETPTERLPAKGSTAPERWMFVAEKHQQDPLARYRVTG